jgi:hypothetical protein
MHCSRVLCGVMMDLRVRYVTVALSLTLCLTGMHRLSSQLTNSDKTMAPNFKVSSLFQLYGSWDWEVAVYLDFSLGVSGQD